MEISETVSSILAVKGPGEIWKVDPSDSVFDAIKLMAERNIGAVLVLEQGKLIGILSERDYARNVILQGRSSRETVVREVMASPVVCVDRGTRVDVCLQLMTEKRIRHLPVVEDGTVAGVVSIGDLVKHIISAQDYMIDQLEKYISGSYPI